MLCSLKGSCGIAYRYLYSASQGISQTKALSAYFSSRKKVKLKVRETRGKGSGENKQAKEGGKRFQSDRPIEAAIGRQPDEECSYYNHRRTACYACVYVRLYEKIKTVREKINLL